MSVTSCYLIKGLMAKNFILLNHIMQGSWKRYQDLVAIVRKRKALEAESSQVAGGNATVAPQQALCRNNTCG
jgi:hypothetical protein